MSPELVGLLIFGVMLVLMFLRIPVALAMIVTAFAGIAVLLGLDQAWNLSGMWAVSSLADSNWLILPVFLLMGEFADMSGMMRDAYRGTNVWLGNLKGGLAMASVVGAALFSAISGSSMACAAIMTRVALPQLIKQKYDPALATGALCAGGTLGNLVPPGILLVFYAVLAEVSLGKLFIACLVPGFLLTFMYMGQIYIQCRLNPAAGPAAGSTPWATKLRELKYLASLFMVFAVVMGGIWFGIFTPNEAASVGTLIVFVFALARRTVNGHSLIEALKNTLINSGMAFALIIGANYFSSFMAVSQLPQTLSVWLMGLGLSALGLVIVLMLVYFILGIPMNALTMMLLTLPVFLPALKAFNVDLIWFGVLVIVQMELANLTPPVGINLFVVAAMSKRFGIKMNTVFNGAYPFVATMCVFNVLLIAFPWIATFLVNMM